MGVTTHRFICTNSNHMADIPDQSVQLVITSPPYPMIEMWDGIFAQQDNSISTSFDTGKPQNAYLKMHNILNSVWDECDRVLQDNCFICINIGDATRTINGNFQMYPNHVQIIDYFQKKRYSVLPEASSVNAEPWLANSVPPNLSVDGEMSKEWRPVSAATPVEDEVPLPDTDALK